MQLVLAKIQDRANYYLGNEKKNARRKENCRCK